MNYEVRKRKSHYLTKRVKPFLSDDPIESFSQTGGGSNEIRLQGEDVEPSWGLDFSFTTE